MAHRQGADGGWGRFSLPQVQQEPSLVPVLTGALLAAPSACSLTSGAEKGTDWHSWLMIPSAWDQVQSREKHKIITLSMKP